MSYEDRALRRIQAINVLLANADKRSDEQAGFDPVQASEANYIHKESGAEAQTCKILLPISDAIYGKAATDFAREHHWEKQPHFYLLHVIEPVTCLPFPPEEVAAIVEEEKRMASLLLSHMAQRLKARFPAVDVDVRIKVGHAKEEILSLARSVGADCIILGAHARTKLERFMLGNVASSVCAAADCSTVMVRLPKQSSAESECISVTEEDLPQSICSYNEKNAVGE